LTAVIYYFSGTGNSLFIARGIAGELGGEAVSIARLAREEKISPKAQIVGIVHPVYAFGVPLIVERFVSKLDLAKDQYLFTVANYAKVQGAGISRMHRSLKRKGLSPKAGFGMVMPNNYTPFGEAACGEKREILFRRAGEKIKEIARKVRSGLEYPPETGSFLLRWLVGEPVGFLGGKMMNSEDRNFFTSEKCDACGICSRVCPVDNIKFELSRPVWKHRCELCFACFQWCPREAIEFGKNTAGKKRYRHPGAVLGDMLLR